MRSDHGVKRLRTMLKKQLKLAEVDEMVINLKFSIALPFLNSILVSLFTNFVFSSNCYS